MKKIITLHLVANLLSGALLSSSVFALTADEVECVAWTHDQSEVGRVERKVLKKTTFDPEYYNTEIGVYSFGADYSYLPQDALGLIVYDNKSNRFTSGTSGFRRVGDTKVFETVLRYYDRLPDGRTIVAGLQCTYLAK
jgi:hypothetical protein